MAPAAAGDDGSQPPAPIPAAPAELSSRRRRCRSQWYRQRGGACRDRPSDPTAPSQPHPSGRDAWVPQPGRASKGRPLVPKCPQTSGQAGHGARLQPRSHLPWSLPRSAELRPPPFLPVPEHSSDKQGYDTPPCRVLGVPAPWGHPSQAWHGTAKARTGHPRLEHSARGHGLGPAVAQPQGEHPHARRWMLTPPATLSTVTPVSGASHSRVSHEYTRVVGSHLLPMPSPGAPRLLPAPDPAPAAWGFASREPAGAGREEQLGARAARLRQLPTLHGQAPPLPVLKRVRQPALA